MPFVREKGGQILVVRSVRTPEKGVRQQILTRVSSMDLLAKIVEGDGVARWEADLAWRHPEIVDWNWSAIRTSLAAALRRFRRSVVRQVRGHAATDRALEQLVAGISTLTRARDEDRAFLERVRPKLDHLRAELERLLDSPARDDNQKKELHMMNHTQESDTEADRLFDAGMEHWWDGDRARACPLFRRALRSDPGHVDAHVHLGIAAFERGRKAVAEKHYLTALASGEKALVRDGKEVHWGQYENRPYLRALGNLGLVRRAQRRWKDALQIHERMLLLNPNDNQGARYLLCEERLRSGDVAGAMRENPDGDDPGALFSRALAHIVGQAEPRALGVALLQAFGANRYVAPMLLGEPWQRLDGFHGSNLAEPECAAEYVEMCADLWREAPTSASVLRFWWKAGPVIAWRADIDACIVDLGKLEAGPARHDVVSRFFAMRDELAIRDVARRVLRAE